MFCAAQSGLSLVLGAHGCCQREQVKPRTKVRRDTTQKGLSHEGRRFNGRADEVGSRGCKDRSACFCCPFYEGDQPVNRGTLGNGTFATMSFVGRAYASANFRLVIVGMDHGEAFGDDFTQRREGIEHNFHVLDDRLGQHYHGIVQTAVAVLGKGGEHCQHCVTRSTARLSSHRHASSGWKASSRSGGTCPTVPVGAGPGSRSRTRGARPCCGLKTGRGEDVRYRGRHAAPERSF
jgi:hypothetical protein